MPFSDGKGTADDVLVGVCDVCGDVVAIPAQSTPSIREARARELVSVEAKLPAVYVDVLDLAAYAIDPQVSTDFRKVMLTWFVHRCATETSGVSSLLEAHGYARATFPERRGIARRRISMKVSPRVESDFRLLEEGTALNKTELLKSVVWRIRDEILESPRKTVIRQLKDLSTIVVR